MREKTVCAVCRHNTKCKDMNILHTPKLPHTIFPLSSRFHATTRENFRCSLVAETINPPVYLWLNCVKQPLLLGMDFASRQIIVKQ